MPTFNPQPGNGEAAPGDKRLEDFKRIVEVLKEAKAQGIEKLVTHGAEYRNETGYFDLWLKPDLDAQAGLYLLEIAGIKARFVEMVEKGRTIPGALHIDTGPYEYPTITPDGSIFFSDHGEKKPAKPSSATQQIYETLVAAGLLKKEKWLDNFVKFVTETDNLSYPEVANAEFFADKSWHALYGIYKELPLSYLVKMFRDHSWDSGNRPLYRNYRPGVFGNKKASPKIKAAARKEQEAARREVVKYKEVTRDGKVVREPVSMWDITEKARRLAERSMKNIKQAHERMKQEGIKFTTPELGRVLFNTVETRVEGGVKKRFGQIPSGFPAIRISGYESWVTWDEDNKSFAISSSKNLEGLYARVKTVAPGAVLIRGQMIILPRSQGQPGLDYQTLLSAIEMLPPGAAAPIPGAAAPMPGAPRPPLGSPNFEERAMALLSKLRPAVERMASAIGENPIELFGALLPLVTKALKEIPPGGKVDLRKMLEENLSEWLDIVLPKIARSGFKDLALYQPELFEKLKKDLPGILLDKDEDAARKKMEELNLSGNAVSWLNDARELLVNLQHELENAPPPSDEERRRIQEQGKTVQEGLMAKVKEALPALGTFGVLLLLGVLLALLVVVALGDYMSGGKGGKRG